MSDDRIDLKAIEAAGRVMRNHAAGIGQPIGEDRVSLHDGCWEGMAEVAIRAADQARGLLVGERYGRVSEIPRTEQPRCAACGQPLASWMHKHTVEDCRNWKAMRESERQEVEWIVRAG